MAGKIPNEEQIRNEARTYLEGDMTFAQTAESLNISRKTFQLHLGKLKNIDPELYKLVRDKQATNITMGRSKGGKVGGGKVSTYTKEEVIGIASKMVSQMLTYRDAEDLLGIPSSTIHDLVHSDFVPQEIRDQLDELAYLNRKGTSMPDENLGRGLGRK